MPRFIQGLVLLSAVFCGDSNLMPHIQGPMLVEEPPPKVAFSNTTGIVLRCVARGIPPPEIRWLDANDKEIRHIHRIREVLTNGSLYFPPFSMEEFNPDVHSSTYRCKAINSAGIVLSRYIRIKADVSQSYQVQVEDAFVQTGNVAVLKCGAPNYVRPHLVITSWQREELSQGKTTLQPTGRYSMTMFGSLHISDAVLSDSYSSYYCQTIHHLTGEKRISLPGKIMVRDPDEESSPTILHSIPVVSAKVGTPADLVCVARGHPPPEYRWYKDSYGSLQQMVSHPQKSALHFSSVQSEDAGRYICVVSNKIGEDRRDVTLSVYAPLSVDVRPPRLVVDAGRDATFNCSVTGGGESRSVTWLRDGRRLHDSGWMLYLHHVTRDDRGMYQCVVRDGEDSAQGTGELVLGAVAPEFQATFIEQSLQPGPPVSLRCVASGHPPPHITWFLDGADITPSKYILGSFLDSTGDVVSHLNISSVRVQHGGLYTCTARNIVGSVSYSATLNIYGPPTSRSPTNKTLVSGENALLRCPVAGFPITKVTWRKSGDILPAHMRQRVLDNNTLIIERVDGSSDNGEYLCTASNQQGQTAKGKVYLTVMKPPRIAPFQFPGGLEEHMRVQVSCNIVSGDFPMSITWEKDGAQVPKDDTVIQERREEFASNIIFRDLGARHSGNYTCIASNSAAVDNYTAALIVSVAPKWVVEPQDVSVLYHHPASVHCQSEGSPSPSIHWMKQKGEPSSGYAPLDFGPHYIIYSNGTLFIQSVDLSDEGRYSCQATNGIGSPITKNIFLKVNVPAHFRSHVVNQSGVTGEPVILVCEAQGDAPLRVSWMATQWPLTPSRTQIVERRTPGGLAAELHIEQLTRKDGGHYRCMASNDYGQDEMDVFLSVKEPPESPHSVEVQESGSRWVVVTWVPPFSTLTHYVVQHRNDGDGSSWNNVTVSGDIRSTKLGSLHPDTSYSIRVIAVNDVGASIPSDITVIHTLQEAPSGTPLHVVAESSSSESIIVKWKPPHHSESHGAILGYKIEYEGPGGESSKTVTVRGHKLETTLTELHKYTRYGITVRAFNSMGSGPASPTVYVTTDEGVPDKPPQNVRCSAVSPQSLRVQWEPPPKNHHNGIIAGYKVFYRHINPAIERTSTTEIKKTPSLETNLHGLLKYGNYSIRVLAFTSAGEGVKSNQIFCLTEEDVPGPPAQIKALVVSADSIMIVWEKPKEPNGIIIKYFIYSRSAQQNSVKDVKKDAVAADINLSFEIRRLHEHSRYEFWVSAATSVGEGLPSSKVVQSPISRAPARIAAFSRIITAPINSDIILSCRAVGLPAPAYFWRDPDGEPITLLLPDHGIALNNLRPEYAGNYTCYVENVFGRDQITYTVKVQAPPGPPVLSISNSTSHSLQVHWKVNSGGAFLTGYTLKYRRDTSEWLEVSLEPELTTFKLEGLKCGSRYQLYMTAYNTVGKGTPSVVITASTKGRVPRVPADDNIIFVNTTSVTLYLESWPTGGCPIHYFVVEYKASTDNDWTLVSNSAQAEELLIPALIPSTKYIIKVTAYSDAGSNYREFLVSTRSLAGELIILNSSMSEETEELSAFYAKLNVIIPIITGILFSISAVICLFVIIMRKQYVRAVPPPYGDKTLAELENQRNSDQQHGKRDSSVGALKASEHSGRDDEISPYATFNYPGFAGAPSTQSMDYSMQFSTFSQKECYAGRPGTSAHSREYKPGYRHKDIEIACTSDSPPDGLSLEISCISSQHNIGKSHFALSQLPRSKSSACAQHAHYDTDSSGEDRHYRKPPQHGCVFEPGSSTESIEPSPEMKPKARRGRASHRDIASR